MKGHGVKATSCIFADLTDTSAYNYVYASTNNSGASDTVYVGYDQAMGNDRTGEYFRILNNCRLSYFDNTAATPNMITLEGGASGTAFGKFLADIEYKWWAWI